MGKQKTNGNGNERGTGTGMGVGSGNRNRLCDCSVCIVSLIGNTTALVVLPPTGSFAASLSKAVFTVCMSAWG